MANILIGGGFPGGGDMGRYIKKEFIEGAMEPTKPNNDNASKPRKVGRVVSRTIIRSFFGPPGAGDDSY